jgi:hypothetical protein
LVPYRRKARVDDVHGSHGGNIIATHMPRNSGKVIDAAGPASTMPMLSVWSIPGARPEVIESAPEVRSMNSQARAAKLSRTMNTTAADVRSTPTGQTLWPVPEARPCVTANLPDLRRNLHAPPSVSLLARARWKRAPSQYYAAGSEPSRALATQGVDQSRAAVPRIRLYRSLPLPRVISQRHAFVCSSLKILAAQCWEQRGTATPSS